MAIITPYPTGHTFTAQQQQQRADASVYSSKWLVESANGDTQFIRMYFDPGEPTTDAQVLILAAMKHSQAGWQTLKSWKKARWSRCARVKFLERYPSILTGAWSGFALYQSCWLAQGIAQGKQPISPCSARMTDPSASPFDYTP